MISLEPVHITQALPKRVTTIRSSSNVIAPWWKNFSFILISKQTQNDSALPKLTYNCRWIIIIIQSQPSSGPLFFSRRATGVYFFSPPQTVVKIEDHLLNVWRYKRSQPFEKQHHSVKDRSWGSTVVVVWRKWFKLD